MNKLMILGLIVYSILVYNKVDFEVLSSNKPELIVEAMRFGIITLTFLVYETIFVLLKSTDDSFEQEIK